MRQAPLVLASLVLVACTPAQPPAAPAATVQLQSDQDRTLYALGLAIGQNVREFNLTAAEILKVVRAKRTAIQACYERQLQRNKGLSGKITIRWKITPQGAVLSPKVASTSMRNGAVEDCIVRQIQNMKFPSPRNGETAVVNFPFIFAPR